MILTSILGYGLSAVARDVQSESTWTWWQNRGPHGDSPLRARLLNGAGFLRFRIVGLDACAEVWD